MTLKIGFIGVGGIAEVHLRNLSAMDGVRIAGVYDINPARAKDVGQRYGTRHYGSTADLLDACACDAVYVCLPPAAHGAQEQEVIERGIPLFVEKPLATELGVAKELLAAIAQKQVLTSVGYHWRYSQATTVAKEALAGRKIGMVQGYWLGTMPEVGWWRRHELSGGQMIEQTTHIVDLARFVAGEITQVYAAYALRTMHEIAQDVTTPDVGSVTLQFASGVVGSITNTCLLDQGYTIGLDVLTRDAIAEIRSEAATVRTRQVTTTWRNDRSPYALEDEAFIQALRTGDPKHVRSSYADAFATHRVTLAAAES
ncbi:MAG: Gfo/Idh/MocA family oxidoreductase, partial [Firmicutes bacterium]|nr:Gfo/Idh/MocA family oxidoreductase [Bacillota bacterium]